MKKRMIGWLLALVMAATLLPVQALAAGLEQPGELRQSVDYRDPTTGKVITVELGAVDAVADEADEEDESTLPYTASADTYNYNEAIPRYGYNKLAEMADGAALTGLYERLLETAKQYDGTGTYDSYIKGNQSPYVSTSGLAAGITKTQAWLVLNTLRNDHPELFWIMSACGYQYTSGRDYCSAVYMFFYRYDTSMEQTKAVFLNAADQLLADAPQDGSDYDKEKYLHDALAEHITYNIEKDDQGAYTVLVTGEGLCAGYAAALQYLLHRSGVEGFTVTGTAGGNHAWSMVKLGENWHFVDLTWDDQESYISYSYFNRGTEFMSQTHTIDESDNVPVETLYDYETSGGTTEPEEWVWDYNDDYHALMKGNEGIFERHIYEDSWFTVQKATCAEDGLQQRWCTVCGHTQERVIPATGQHLSIAWFVCGDYEIECECRSCGATWKQSQFANTVLDDGTVAVGGFWGDQEDIVIPRQLNGLPVTRITQDDSYPFYRNSELKTVTLPNTVTTLSANAFADCAALETIVIPASVTTIEEKVFSGCDNLKDIYYLGGQQQWVAISKDYMGNAPLNRPATTIHYVQSGDLNGNGSAADATDVQCLYTYLTSGVIDGALAQREGIFRAVADVNGDGSVDVYDLQRLYETASGLDQAA